jgi:hypothetical protein
MATDGPDADDTPERPAKAGHSRSTGTSIASDKAASAGKAGVTPPPSDYAPTALPSTGARVLAFAAILVAGFCGGVIGYAFTDLQCEGDCTVQTGIGGLTGALIGAIGVAIVATLALRALGEWRTIQHRDSGT